jgi:galactose mutarotase-like enzyme
VTRVADGAVRLAAGELEALFLPARGMLGASLRHRGAELLRRVDDLDAAAAKGSTAGIPLLHPWANRLASLRWRAAGRDVALERASPLLHFDDDGQAIHGVPWPLLAWEVVAAERERLVARLDWERADLLAVFPFRHALELAATLAADGLSLETTLRAADDGPVPVAFGFHPYLGLPDLERGRWRLELPAMKRLALDARGIPTGVEEPFAALDEPLAERTFDDGFAGLADGAVLAIRGAGRRVAVELAAGYPCAQVYVPPGKDFVALEPMTAPTNALASGRGLRVVEPGGSFRAAFRIRVDAL